jgi:hypothetical protein
MAHVVDDWMGGPTTGRKSYKVKVKKAEPTDVHDSDDEKPKERPSWSSSPQKFTPAVNETKKEEHIVSPSQQAPSSPQKTEVDPAVAKYKASPIAQKENIGHGGFSNAFAKFNSPPAGSPSKRNFRVSKEARASDVHAGSNAFAMFNSPSAGSPSKPNFRVSKEARASDVHAGSAPEHHVMHSPVAQFNSPSAGSPSKPNFRVSKDARALDVHAGSAPEHDVMDSPIAQFNSPSAGSPSKPNFRVSKDARASDVHAGSIQNIGNSFSNLHDSGPELDDSQKKEFAESVQMLRKVWKNLDDRDYNYGELEKVIKKLDKVAQTGGNAKPTLENTIPRLQKMARKFYDEDQSETELALEKLIDINLAL